MIHDPAVVAARMAFATPWVVLLLLAGAGVAYALRGRDDGPPRAGTTPSPAVRLPSAAPSANASPPPGADLTGPFNLLLVGVDTRVTIPDWRPHADSIMVLHVEAGLRSAYLFSLPRDLRVDIPAFPANGYGGGRHKITEAMAYGSRVRGSDKADVAQGYLLLGRTVAAYMGLKRFDAGAVLTFGGLDKLTDALGGVTLTIDQRVRSEHRQPDGSARPPRPGGNGYVGPQAVYQPGVRKLTGWQAIDYARQRYGLPAGDYDRQRHQRQLVRALFERAGQVGLTTDTARLGRVITALDDAVLISGYRPALEYAYALRNLAPSRIVPLALPGRSVFNGGYIGEQLDPLGRNFLKALAAGRPGPYVRAHPELVSK